MVGVPRVVASSLTQALTGDISTYSYKKIRQIINNLSVRDWDALIPRNSRLSGEEWKRIVNILMKEK